MRSDLELRFGWHRGVLVFLVQPLRPWKRRSSVDETGELPRLQRLRRKQPALQLRLIHGQKRLEVRQRRFVHLGQMRLRIAPDQEIEFLGAPVRRAPGRPAAAGVDCVAPWIPMVQTGKGGAPA